MGRGRGGGGGFTLVGILVGIVIRLRHPDRVSTVLTDLARREERLIEVAVPPPWRLPPLSGLPEAGDAMTEDGGRGQAFLEELRTDSTYPIARFRITARVDPERRFWFQYRELIPGENFSFRTPRYAMEGVIVAVEAGSAPEAAGDMVGR